MTIIETVSFLIKPSTVKRVFLGVLIFALVSFAVNFAVLTRRLQVNRAGSLFDLNGIARAKATGPRIFCMILTTPENLGKRAVYVQQSWAYKCDKHKFITIVPENLVRQKIKLRESRRNNETVELDYLEDYTRIPGAKATGNQTIEVLTTTLPLYQPAGFEREEYKKLTYKVFYMMLDIEQDYGDYDWYLKTDDDTMIFVDNLREFLADKNSSGPFTYGYNFKVKVDKGYHSGGGGYVLPRKALSDLASKLRNNSNACQVTGIEDVDVAKCLRTLGYEPGFSLDDQQKERFHPLNLIHHYYGILPSWLSRYAQTEAKNGLDCCSDSSISFHYVTPREMMIMGDLVRNSSRKPTLKDIVLALGLTSAEAERIKPRPDYHIDLASLIKNA